MDTSLPVHLPPKVTTMHPPTKDQTTLDVDNPTLDASDGALIETKEGEVIENKDMARQEFANDADINYMLSKFKITPERGAPTYGEWDDTIDLQQAIASVTEARQAFRDLPEELRKKFNNMEELLQAYANGSLVIKEGEEPVPPKTEAQILQERITELEKRLNTTPE